MSVFTRYAVFAVVQPSSVVLSLRSLVGTCQIVYSPGGEMRLGFFKDGSILGWEDNFAFKFQLSTAVPHDSEAATAATAAPPSPSLKTFSCSREGRYLAAGGKSHSLFLWDLATESLLRLVQVFRVLWIFFFYGSHVSYQLPDPVHGIRQVQFVWLGPDSAENNLVSCPVIFFL